MTGRNSPLPGCCAWWKTDSGGASRLRRRPRVTPTGVYDAHAIEEEVPH